jgi:hypothetical protein
MSRVARRLRLLDAALATLPSLSLIPSAPFAHVLLRFLHFNGRQSRIITSFVPQSRDYRASGAAYDQFVIYCRSFDFCASGNLTLD